MPRGVQLQVISALQVVPSSLGSGPVDRVDAELPARTVRVLEQPRPAAENYRQLQSGKESGFPSTLERSGEVSRGEKML